jgi:cystathionine beta-lyase/cystathionine gamma-synthase
MKNPKGRIETRLVHAGEPELRIEGAVCLPIFQSSTFEYAGQDDYHQVRYARLNNTPNHLVLHEKLAALEEGEAALVTASGMAAISTTLLSLLAPGERFLAQDNLYGGTHSLITEHLAALDISTDFIDGNDPASWERKLRPNTRLIYVETITNPLIQVADLLAVVRFARAHGLLALIDNTFASPLNFRPLAWDYDLSLHSATKYLNGHADIIAGAVIGRANLVERITHKLNHLGGTLDPHACYLLHRGLKTLAVRVRYQNESAQQIAHFLESHPAVARVNYPGLQSHPQHRRASELFDGFGGMLSFELKGDVEQAERLMQRLRLPICAPSLGGAETLITRPATTSHSGMTPEQRRAIGISDTLMRLSVGLEATQDLIEDFDQALSRLV